MPDTTDISTRGGFVRKGIVAVALAALAVATASPAGAQPIDCEDFGRTQTYYGWGPSLHYGKTVTVAYAPSECSGSWSDGAFSYSVAGTATIFEGKHPAGSTIATLPFSNKGSFTDPDGQGWPPAWWSCLSSADVSWQISDIYSFRATASDGGWSLGINVSGASPFRWSYSAC